MGWSGDLGSIFLWPAILPPEPGKGSLEVHVRQLSGDKEKTELRGIAGSQPHLEMAQALTEEGPVEIHRPRAGGRYPPQRGGIPEKADAPKARGPQILQIRPGHGPFPGLQGPTGQLGVQEDRIQDIFQTPGGPSGGPLAEIPDRKSVV